MKKGEYDEHYITIAGSIITRRGESPDWVVGLLRDFLDNELIGWLPDKWVESFGGTVPASREQGELAGFVELPSGGDEEAVAGSDGDYAPEGA